jgi:bisphosphoglycerate-independent phosphoglycerate mutase (AlkP superfamily)
MTNDKIDLQQNGALRDVAPTLLGILGFEQPEQMKGKDLRIKLS